MVRFSLLVSRRCVSNKVEFHVGDRDKLCCSSFIDFDFELRLMNGGTHFSTSNCSQGWGIKWGY